MSNDSSLYSNYKTTTLLKIPFTEAKCRRSVSMQVQIAVAPLVCWISSAHTQEGAFQWCQNSTACLVMQCHSYFHGLVLRYAYINSGCLPRSRCVSRISLVRKTGPRLARLGKKIQTHKDMKKINTPHVRRARPHAASLKLAELSCARGYGKDRSLPWMPQMGPHF